MKNTNKHISHSDFIRSNRLFSAIAECRRYVSAAALLVGLASCQNDDFDRSGYETDPTAIRIQATVGDLLTRSNPTDETSLTLFNKGDRIAVSVGERVDNIEQGPVVYKLGEDGQTWSPEDSYLKWNKEQYAFMAYYPAGVFTGSEDVPTDQGDVEKMAAADYMWFRQVVTKQSGLPLKMEMQRRTSRIVIKDNYIWKDQYLADDKTTQTHEVKRMRIHSAGKEGLLTITPCNVGGTYYALVNPSDTENADAAFITVTVGPKGSTDEAEYDELVIRGIPALQAGNSYDCHLTLGKDKAFVSGVEIVDWTTGSVIDNGQASDDYVMFVTVGGTYSYHIYTLSGLLEVNKILTASDVTAQMLRADITLYDNFTLPAPTGDQTSNWTPIGTKDMPFDGTFYGNGKTITGLVIDNPNTAYQGLIGCLSGSVYNLTLVGCTVKGNGRAGGIAGRVSSGRMSECTVKATKEYPIVIESKDSYSGGIVAEAIRVTISNCLLECEANASITIKGLDYSSYVGGIAGSHELEGTITQCNVINRGGTITLEGGNNVGGLVGMNEGSSISGCSVDGVSAKGLAYVGGFAGENNNTATITGTNTVKNSKIEGWEGFTEITVGNNATVSVTDGSGNSVKKNPKNTYN